jgi:hypothetical protein
MPDYDTEMHLLAPKETSFTYLLKKLPKEDAKGNYTFTCFEDEHVTQYLTVNAATTAAATAITIDSNAAPRRNDIFLNERTGECVLIEIVASATSLDTVVRAFGSTTAAPMIDGDILVRLGNSSAEGMGTGDAVHTTVGTKVNYLQEFREPIFMTDRAIRSENYTGKDWPYQVQKTMKKFAMDKERQFLWGEAYTGTFASNGTTEVGAITTDAMPITQTRGIITFIKQYADASRVWNVGGTLTEDDFIKKFLEPAFEFGSDNKILFASTKLMMAMGYWKWKKVDLKSGDTTLDLIFNKIDTPIGILTLVHHRQLDVPNAGANGTAANGSCGIVLDMKAPLAIKQEMPLTKFTVYEPYKNPSGYSARKEEIVEVCGLKAADIDRHAFLYGIQSYS